MNQDPRVDDLRQQLRALGYLDAGVDRFLLAPAGGTRGPIALAVRASARVGLLGGLLLGPSAAIGIGARLPGLLNGVRVGFVVALYLAVFFFVAITASSFAVTLASMMAARSRDAQFARRAALLFSPHTGGPQGDQSKGSGEGPAAHAGAPRDSALNQLAA